MANAISTTKTVITNVTLDLTAAEAKALTEILACVGGPPAGPRGQADNVLQALKAVGFTYTSLRDGSHPFNPHARSLIFKDEVVSDPWSLEGVSDYADMEPPF